MCNEKVLCLVECYMKKRLLSSVVSCVLSFVMIVSLISPTLTLASSDTVTEGITWAYDSETKILSLERLFKDNNCSMAEAAHDILYKGQNVGKVVLTVK